MKYPFFANDSPSSTNGPMDQSTNGPFIKRMPGYWHSAATLNFLRGYAASGDHDHGLRSITWGQHKQLGMGQN